ncbi:MAG: response regulator [Chloroflexi bacterium]|nr:response regulator [Chloroflexota bacterium]
MGQELHILIVDDDRLMANTLRDILRLKGYLADTAYCGAEALASLEREPFGCVLSDIKMPDIHGVDLYRAIQARYPTLPVVLITAYARDELVRQGLEEGVIACLSKPLDINRLLALFDSLRKERSVVLVDDDALFCRTLGDILRARGFLVTEITDPHQVLSRIQPDGQVMLLDLRLNHITGLDVLREIRKSHPRLPVILLTGYREQMAPLVEAAQKLTAYACLYKPLQIDHLLQTLTRIAQQELGSLLTSRR